MYKDNSFKKISSKVLDLSFVASILFVILLFTTASSGFDVTETVGKSEVVNEPEVKVVNIIRPIRKRSPKPETPAIEIDVHEGDFIEDVPIDEPLVPSIEAPTDEPHFEEPISSAKSVNVWTLTKMPDIVSKVAPKYPSLAKKHHIEGRVVLRYILDEEGNVTEIKVVKGHLLLNEAAIVALKKYKYTPGLQNGVPVKVKMTQMFHFKLK